jgi:hypothetical protein
MKFTAKATLASLAAAGAGMFLQSTPAHAVPILTVRCATDAIDIPTAKLRLEWARACGDRINVVSPVLPVPPAQAVATGMTSANGGIPLVEYIETDDFFGRDSFSGDVASVNQTYVQNQWRVGPITATKLADGFQKWTEADSFFLTRPTYQTFGNNADINLAVQLFPSPNYSLLDCGLFTNAAGTTRANTSVTGFFVNGFCTASCYTPDQEISFASGDMPILDALNTLKTGVKTLTPSSTLDNISLKTDEVSTYTREIHDSTHVIFDIRTKSGGELKVTDKHPVLVDSGRILEARSLKAGQSLIKADGTRDPIVSVEKTTHFGKVYNLKPAATNRVANILIAQGFLVGSSRYQNEDVDFMNRIILGRAVPKAVIPQ